MKVILCMAQTINGIIAREDYSEDFLSHKNWEVFLSLAKQTGCFIIGRKTYQEVKKWEGYNFDSIKAVKIVVSRDKNFSVGKGYLLANSPKEALEKASGFSKVLLTGGGNLNSTFMKEKLVDEIILNIEPCCLGKGIRIFSENEFEAKLRFVKMNKFSPGIVQLHYKVLKQ